MSFLFGGKPQLSSAEKVAAAETEVEMISDMFNRWVSSATMSLGQHLILHARLVQSCTKKCIPTDYREADLNKGESVCLDRCVSKMFEVNVKVSEKMQEASGNKGGAGGMGFGM